MNFRKFGILSLLMAICYFNIAQAATIGIEPTPTIIVNLGDQVNSTLNIDFGANEESTGGTFVIKYDDTILSNPNITFESNLLSNFGITDKFFDDSISGEFKVSFGSLNLNAGVIGAGALAQLTFETTTTGVSMLVLDDADGGFRDFINNVQPITYEGTQVQVVTAVPLPGAVWLFVSSIGVLITYRKKITATT